MLVENVRVALEALFGNRLRSILTLLGVVIGVFAVTTTISLGAIATAGITSELQAFGAQTLFVTVNTNHPQATRFTDADVEALSRLPIDILRQQSRSAELRFAERSLPISLNGTTANAIEVDRTLTIARGRYFSEQEARVAANVIVLSAQAADELFDEGINPIGQEVSLTVGSSRALMTVIGVLAPIGGTLGAFANQAAADVPLETFYSVVPGARRGEYSFLPISIELDRNAADIEAQVRAILDRRRGAGTYNIQTIEGALSLFNTITLILQAVLGGIGAISLLVGGIGILNIMLVSVTERTREIGLRKALGAKRGTILQQFLIEAVVLTVIGGLVGMALAVLTLYLLVALVPFLDRVVLSPWVLLMAFGVSVATGVIFGVWPASRAANLSPIEALRYE